MLLEKRIAITTGSRLIGARFDTLFRRVDPGPVLLADIVQTMKLRLTQFSRISREVTGLSRR